VSEGVFDLKAYLSRKRTVVEHALEAFSPAAEELTYNLTEAMKYSLFAGGKRLRPILCIAGSEAVGGDETRVLPAACALEYIHTYSLIHDDLPMMDDDDLRRGKPTSHRIFGQAIALLAGDGLLTEAFHLMTSPELAGNIPLEKILRAIGLIARAAGYRGMVGGQAVDIEWEGRQVDFSVVEFIHTHKTGALITASVTSGAILGQGTDTQVEAVSSYGRKIGLAFQISDDILDIEGDTETLGKEVGADEKGARSPILWWRAWTDRGRSRKSWWRPPLNHCVLLITGQPPCVRSPDIS
jgi:geranylgeranyl diphosphate synthase type II